MGRKLKKKVLENVFILWREGIKMNNKRRSLNKWIKKYRLKVK